MARVEERFANRFEAAGDGYVFRANLRAVGYPFSAEERDHAVSEFKRRYVWLTWGFSAATISIFMTVVWLFFSQSDHVPDAAIYLVLGVCAGLYLIPFYWLWNAPVRLCRDRVQGVEGRTTGEARRVAFERLTWTQLGTTVLLVGLMLWRVSARANLLVGWNRLWLLLGAATLVLVVVQAIRKLAAQIRK